MRQHRTRMKNAPVVRPRQRRQVQGVLGRGLGYVLRLASGLFCFWLALKPLNTLLNIRDNVVNGRHILSTYIGT